MPFYRIGEPGKDFSAHLNFGRKAGPVSCVAARLEGDNPIIGARCARAAVALCDAPAGKDLAGTPQTCSAPICEYHRTPGGADVDYCPRHAHLAPRPLPLEGGGSDGTR